MSNIAVKVFAKDLRRFFIEGLPNEKDVRAGHEDWFRPFSTAGAAHLTGEIHRIIHADCMSKVVLKSLRNIIFVLQQITLPSSFVGV